MAAVAALLFVSPVRAADSAQKKGEGSTVEVAVAPQKWQIRRNETIQAFNAYYRSDFKDKVAAGKVDAILSNIENNPWSVTPMEAMDIYGVFYVPNEGAKDIAGILKLVSMYAIVGLYDVYRFGDASALAEIMNNEGFLKRAFTLGGDAGVKQLMEFLEKHPKEAESAVAGGVSLAFDLAERAQYDVRWPTAYGLARMTCATEKRKSCPPPEALPKEKWNYAFAEAINTVSQYYRAPSKK